VNRPGAQPRWLVRELRGAEATPEEAN